ncbi:MAG: diphthamide synthesis protein [Candidatus Woesearchaeota archaeon]|jgi:2-(3-amino-3-carboxypropyl)histidine synthase
MKTLFLEARVKINIQLTAEQIKQLPKDIALFTTVQFIDSLNAIKHQLEAAGIAVTIPKAKHTRYAGQILGCEFIASDAKAFLYVGDGIFHPQAIAVKNNKPIYCYNPYTKQMILFDRKDIDTIVKKHKIAIIKFLEADTIGIIVSAKPGQQWLKRAVEFKKKCNAKEKKTYIFMANTIDFVQLNNFPFVQCWVNSACPRIGLDDKNKVDKPIVNLEDVFSLV